jgi:stearoyl-CoA desaturase (delta-9 desaturase)
VVGLDPPVAPQPVGQARGRAFAAQYGLWRAHAGWLLYRRNSRLKADLVRDLLRFPELAFLDRHYHVVPMAWAFGTLLVGGLPGLYWGFVVSTLLLFHVMGLGNSLAHWRGPRRYNTPDNSRNSVLYSLGTLGEFHNNHHHDPSSANQRRAWWELDLIHLALKLLSKTGLVWDLRLRHGTRRGSCVPEPRGGNFRRSLRDDEE